MTPSRTLREWSDWYHFARQELGYEHAESVDYANHRFVEEQNRAVLQLLK